MELGCHGSKVQFHLVSTMVLLCSVYPRYWEEFWWNNAVRCSSNIPYHSLLVVLKYRIQYHPISLENYQLGLAANVPKVRSFWVGIIESQVTRIQVTTIPVSWKSWHFPSVCCLEVSVFDFSGVKIAPTTSIHRRNCIVLSLRYLLTVSRISQFPRNFWPESVCPFPGEKHMGRNDAIQYRVAKLRTRHGWGFEPYKDCPFAATWCVLWFWGMLGMMTMADYGDMHLDDEQVFCWGQ